MNRPNCCEKCANGGTKSGYALGIAAPYCLDVSCDCHNAAKPISTPTEGSMEERLENLIREATGGTLDTPLIANKERLTRFITQEKELSYLQGRNDAVEYLQSQVSASLRAKGFPLTFDNGSWTFLMKEATRAPKP